MIADPPKLTTCPGCGSSRMYGPIPDEGIVKGCFLCSNCYGVWNPDGSKRVSPPSAEHIHEVSSATGYCSCGGKIEKDKLARAGVASSVEKINCKGVRSDGRDCTGWAMANGYCTWHQDQADPDYVPKVKPVTAATNTGAKVECKGTRTDKKPCSGWALANGYCYFHQDQVPKETPPSDSDSTGEPEHTSADAQA